MRPKFELINMSCPRFEEKGYMACCSECGNPFAVDTGEEGVVFSYMTFEGFCVDPDQVN